MHTRLASSTSLPVGLSIIENWWLRLCLPLILAVPIVETSLGPWLLYRPLDPLPELSQRRNSGAISGRLAQVIPIAPSKNVQTPASTCVASYDVSRLAVGDDATPNLQVIFPAVPNRATHRMKLVQTTNKPSKKMAIKPAFFLGFRLSLLRTGIGMAKMTMSPTHERTPLVRPIVIRGSFTQ